VVGSGFAGSLLAMIGRRLGLSVVLLERGRHPRFAIGESSTPLANLLLEELADRYDLAPVRSLSKWGTWQRHHSQIPCGLKRGFTFYHHTFGQAFQPRPDHDNELLVGASPRDELADTHWYRPAFDHFFVRQAEALGVEYFDAVALESAKFGHGGGQLSGKRGAQSFQVKAKFVVDATGPRGFLHRALRLPESAFPNLPPTHGLYTHFTGVERFDNLLSQAPRAFDGTPWSGSPFATGAPRTGQTSPEEPQTSRLPAKPPYPPDDAALHHVFDGGWIWVLRFNNGVTSAGVALTAKRAEQFQLDAGAAAWDKLLELLPSVRAQFAPAKPILPFVHSPHLSFCSASAAGPGWALLPSAVGFIDPLLSTGFPLTLLGVARLARTLEESWGAANLHTRLLDYERRTFGELLATERLVASLYAHMNDFPVFRALTLLYFAAVIFSENARRSGKRELVPTFLLHDQAAFGKGLRRCCELAWRAKITDRLAERDRKELFDTVFETIAPIDLAGLSDRTRGHWYPAPEADFVP
jgi:FADH2 O2-dependent halogenase